MTWLENALLVFTLFSQRSGRVFHVSALYKYITALLYDDSMRDPLRLREHVYQLVALVGAAAVVWLNAVWESVDNIVFDWAPSVGDQVTWWHNCSTVRCSHATATTVSDQTPQWNNNALV